MRISRFRPAIVGMITGMTAGLAASLGIATVTMGSDTPAATLHGAPPPGTPGPTVTATMLVGTPLSPRLARAVAACDWAPSSIQAPCVALYLRPAASRPPRGTTGGISDPAGPALVTECRQYTDPDELRSCLTAPSL